MSGNFVSYQDADALMTKIAQKISGGGGTDKAILYYMTDNAMYDGYHVRATGLLSGTVYNTVLDSEGNGDIEVKGMERYSIDFYYIDENEQEVSVYQTAVDAHTGNFVYIPLGYDKTSWQGIQNILDAHKELDLLSIGDEIHTSIGGADYIYQVGAIDLYESHEIIFVPKTCISPIKSQRGGDSNTGGWVSSDIRAYLRGVFKDSIPEEIKKHIKAKTFQTAGGYQSTSIKITEEDIWLPREYEIFGEITYSVPAEQNYCLQYPIFATAAQRIRMNNGSAVNWWSASCPSALSQPYCAVTTAGATQQIYASQKLGVVPCFRFTADV